MSASATQTATYAVIGMTCQHCAASVTEEISELDGVVAVDVALDTGTVSVTSDRELGIDLVAAAVVEAGYRLVEEQG